MYLYSILNERIECKINIKDEHFLSSKIDKYGIFIETRSFKTQRKVYRIEFNQIEYLPPYTCITTYPTIEPTLWKESKIPYLDELNINVEYDSYSSFDGTKIPMTILQKDKVNNDGRKKPCLVYAYGGFGDCLLPRFDLYFLLFVELFNGVVGSYAFIVDYLFNLNGNSSFSLPKCSSTFVVVVNLVMHGH